MERMYKKLCRKAVFVGLSSETDDEAMNHPNGFMGVQSGECIPSTYSVSLRVDAKKD